MKRLISFMLILAIALAIGLGLRNYPGEIMVRVAGWRVDMHLWVAILLLMAFGLLCYFLLKIFSCFIDMDRRFDQWWNKRKHEKMQTLAQEGFLNFYDGKYAVAEKALVKSAHASEVPWLNYLTAAQAAQYLGENEKRDAHLHKAQDFLNSHQNIALLMQAQCHYEQQEYDAALAIVDKIKPKKPPLPNVLLLQKKIYQKQKKWVELIEILKPIEKLKLLSATEYHSLEVQTWRDFLKQNRSSSLELFQKQWKTVPRHLKKCTSLISVYAQVFLDNQQFTGAEKLLRAALNRDWDESLLKKYAHIQHSQPKVLLANAQKWLKAHPKSAVLHYCLGKLCEQSEALSHAQRYYEQSIALQPNLDAYTALAQLYENLNEIAQSVKFYKKGLLLLQRNE